MSAYPEPPNLSIVAWGAFANQVRIRVDEWAYEGSGRNWFPADDNFPYEPTDWASLGTEMRNYGAPHLLVPQGIEPETTDPAAPAK